MVNEGARADFLDKLDRITVWKRGARRGPHNRHRDGHTGKPRGGKTWRVLAGKTTYMPWRFLR